MWRKKEGTSIQESVRRALTFFVLHAFEGKPPLSAETRHRIAEIKRIYGLARVAEHAGSGPGQHP